MNYAQIKTCDIANGIGVRTTLFVSGCRHACPGCFNEVAWDFDAGQPFTHEVEDQIIASLQVPYVNGLSVLGGEPLEPQNQAAIAPFLKRVRTEAPDKDVWLWTGFTWEQVMGNGSRVRTACIDGILDNVDVLVDGPFVEALKDMTLRFRGSSNQRIIDVDSSRKAGKIVLWEDERLFSTRGSW